MLLSRALAMGAALAIAGCFLLIDGSSAQPTDHGRELWAGQWTTSTGGVAWRVFLEGDLENAKKGRDAKELFDKLPCKNGPRFYRGGYTAGGDRGKIMGCGTPTGMRGRWRSNVGGQFQNGSYEIRISSRNPLKFTGTFRQDDGVTGKYTGTWSSHFDGDGAEGACPAPRKPSAHRAPRTTQARNGRARAVEGACAFTWSMVDRFGEDADKDGLIDYPTATTKVPYTVEFNLISENLCRQVVMTAPKAPGDFTWKVDGSPVPAVLVPGRNCVFTYDFPKEGKFKVEVVGFSTSGSDDVVVQDWLIAGLGDSMASGEGNPDTRKRRDAAAKWQFERCHRSANSYQAKTALELENADHKTSVSFIHLGCSGAGISSGVTGPYFGIVPGGADLPLRQQAQELKDWVGPREVDAVLLTIGVNEFEFGSVIGFCAKWDECMTTDYKNGKTLAQFARDRVDALKGLYAELARQLAFVPKNRIYITEYPDFFTGADRRICADILDAKFDSIDSTEAAWLVGSMLNPLNSAVRRAAKDHGWRVVSGAQSEFKGHGYCTPGVERWIVTLTESYDRQGDTNGTVHPNERGHDQLADLVLGVLRPHLYPNKAPRLPTP